MSKVKVYDCFPYFNERELLELRIKLLDDYVDGFYIIDADHTHGGHPKEFSCSKTLEELNLQSDKIKVIEISLPSHSENADNYFRERKQRNAVAEYFEDDAVYIVSDCDEIIDPMLIDIFFGGATTHPDSIMRITLDWLCGKANLRLCNEKNEPIPFPTPFVCMKHHIKDYTLSEIREDLAGNYNKIKYHSLFLQDSIGKNISCGWHFSWMGGNNRMKVKMRSFLHCYDSNTDIFSTAIAPIPSNEMWDYLSSYEPKIGAYDPYGRKEFHLEEYPIENLPKKLLELTHLKSYFFGN